MITGKIILVYILFLLLGIPIVILLKSYRNIFDTLALGYGFGVVQSCIVLFIVGLFNIELTNHALITTLIFYIFIYCILLFIFRSTVDDFFKMLKRTALSDSLFLILILIIGFYLSIIALNRMPDYFNWDEMRVWLYGTKSLIINRSLTKVVADCFLSVQNPIILFSGFIASIIDPINESIIRTINVWFLISISLLLTSCFNSQKLSKLYSYLLSLIFLTSSTCFIVQSLVLYTNIASVFYLFSFFLALFFNEYDRIESYHQINLAFISAIGATMSRYDGLYLIIGLILIIIMFYIYRFKKLNIKLIELFAGIILFDFLRKLFISMIFKVSGFKLLKNIVSFDIIFSRLNPEMLYKHFQAIKLQLFSFTDYYLPFYLFIFCIIALIFLFFINKKFLFPNNHIWLPFIMIISFIILNHLIVELTNLLMFNNLEFLEASSYSRYMMPSVPIIFVLFSMIFKEYEKYFLSMHTKI